MTPARLWLRVLAPLVPRDLRDVWVEEWDAELAASGGGMVFALGALPDAWYLRTDGWTMDGMMRDVRHAVRGLVRKPFFTALAGLTLALGIGANTAIFSVVDGVILDPLPFPDGERMVSVNHVGPGLGVSLVPQSEGTFLFYEEGLTTMKAFAVFTEDNVNLIKDGEPQRLSSATVSAQFFDVLGVQPILGRGFRPGEHFQGAEPVAVLAYATWQQDFGADPGIVGETVEMDGVMRRIVGVAPEGATVPDDAALWIPLEIDATNPSLGSFGLIGFGRLADGATLEGANAQMQNLLLRFSDEHPEELSREILEQTGIAADVKPLKDLYLQDVEQILWVLLGTVGFVLLIACANVANLFLVRAESRQREQSVRSALGASRGDIARQYLTESMALAVWGGLLGLGLAWVGVQGLLELAPVSIPRADEIGIDGSVLAFTAGMSIFAGLLFGLLPALGYGRGDLSQGLKDGGRASTAGRERHRTRSALVVTQVALALVLLVGSGLMLRSFTAMRTIDLGFDTENRLAFRVSLPSAEYPTPEATALFYRTLVEGLEGAAGVERSAVITGLPLEGHTSAGPVESEDDPLEEGELGLMADRRAISPGYFDAMGIGLEGRDLTWEDGAESIRAVVINAALAQALWPGEGALGRRLRPQGSEAGWEVVGLVDDVRYEEVESAPSPMVYFPLTQDGHGGSTATRAMAVVAKTAGGDPLALIPLAREALRNADPRLPMVAPRTVQSIVEESLASTSFAVLLLGIASFIALILGAVGLYGVIAYVVSRRTQEIGVRMALGAPSGQVLREVISQGMVLTGVGLLVGLLGAWGMSRVLASLLFGVSATDPLTYVTVTAGLAVVAVLAAWVPARRASRVDPVEALRSE